ncbi:hypothetical protein ABL78_1714 [Leptomonas seymouri]|uniref:CBF1-interacting co-repressor CIR N-terminal domain-containing protein n=1 Tax=Leptomonas seymouri TaxID=5684 RepID=A0A0N1PD46_LEPSE|nr:hypothetical protein ABL78_1714 [Leptomonas seymouri]|eukprot:KPI89151.1 hypothetical protein ABL78_1714 [Leptomonas seymouri]
MYRAHSKDINRNKSFHPLTYGNLRRVELLKEGEEEKKQRADDRQRELQRDQEERRYDELVLANSADSQSGELARFRQTKNIFKAEYEAELAKRQQESKEEGESSKDLPSTSSSPALPKSPFASSSNLFLSKFKKEGHTQECYASTEPSAIAAKAEVEAEPSDEPASSGVAHGKRPREDGDEKRSTEAQNGSVMTGFVTSAEAARLRKELNLAQKQRHDPLMRVRQYQNSCVATAARQMQHQQRQRDGEDTADHSYKSRNNSAAKDNSDALQSRIRELLALKKKK